MSWLATATFFLTIHVARLTPPAAGVVLGHWNWTGKLLAVVLSLLVLATVPGTRRYVQLPERGGLVPVVIVGGLLLVIAVIAGMVSDRATLDAETLAFQATVPGLDEELTFRGVMLALLVPSSQPEGASRRVPGLVAISLLFGAVHGVAIGGDGVRFIPGYFAWTTVAGLVWGWMTLRTRSILPAMISHNATNTVGYLMTVV